MKQIANERYINERSALISQAEKHANSKHGKTASDNCDDDERLEWCAKWNREFHSAMDSLWTEWNSDRCPVCRRKMNAATSNVTGLSVSTSP